MANKQFDEVLQDAGLDDESIRFIADNKLIAEAVASSARKICDKFRAMIANLGPPPDRKYKGRYDMPCMLKAIAAIQQRNGKVTQKAISKQIGCHQTQVGRLLSMYPEVKVAYLATRNGSASSKE